MEAKKILNGALGHPRSSRNTRGVTSLLLLTASVLLSWSAHAGAADSPNWTHVPNETRREVAAGTKSSVNPIFAPLEEDPTPEFHDPFADETGPNVPLPLPEEEEDDDAGEDDPWFRCAVEIETECHVEECVGVGAATATQRSEAERMAKAAAKEACPITLPSVESHAPKCTSLVNSAGSSYFNCTALYVTYTEGVARGSGHGASLTSEAQAETFAISDAVSKLCDDDPTQVDVLSSECD